MEQGNLWCIIILEKVLEILGNYVKIKSYVSAGSAKDKSNIFNYVSYSFD